MRILHSLSRSLFLAANPFVCSRVDIVRAAFIGGNAGLWQHNGKAEAALSVPGAALLGVWNALASADISVVPLGVMCFRQESSIINRSKAVQSDTRAQIADVSLREAHHHGRRN